MHVLQAAVLSLFLPLFVVPDPNLSAEAAIADAKVLIQKGKVASARAHLKHAISMSPRNAEAYLTLARTWIHEAPHKAREIAMAGAKKIPGDEALLNLLTLSYSRARAEGADQAAEKHLRTLEVNDYQQLLQATPDSPELLYRIASQRLALERLMPPADVGERDRIMLLAIDELQRTVSLLANGAAETQASAHYQLGRALKHRGDLFNSRGDEKKARSIFREALAAFQLALKADSERVDVLGEIVLVHRGMDNGTAAITAVKTHLPKVEAKRVRAKTLSMLGNLYVEARDGKQAVATLSQALELDKFHMDAWLGLYQAHLLTGQRPLAVKALQSAVDAQPAFLLGHLQLGQLSAGEGRHEEAIGHFERVLAVPRPKAVVLGMLPSPNLYRNGLYYQAAAWLAWLHLEHSGELDKALAAVQTAAQFREKDANLRDTEGWIYFQMKDYARAREILESVVQVDGSSPGARYHLAETYFALGEYQRALDAVKVALAASQDFSARDRAQALARKARSKLGS